MEEDDGAERSAAAGYGGEEAQEQGQAGTSTAAWYSAYVFPHEAEPLYRATQEYASYGTSCPNTNFLKGVKWSPDGACLLTASDDNWLRLYDLPRDCHVAGRLTDPDLLPAGAAPAASASDSASAAPPPDNLQPALRMSPGETVYDYCWFPRMTGADPVTCCLASTSRGQPIHLWDACSGSIRCSYRGYNDADEPTAAYSLAFSPDGGRLVAGYNKSLYVFDVARPGREYKRVVTYKRKQAESISGIVSCLAFSPTGDVFAAGTYTGGLGVFDALTSELVLLLSGNKGGLTQVMFSPDGNYLFTGARQDDQMFCWDVRQTYEALYTVTRDTARTNQRIQFDIEPCGKHLVTGGCGGAVAAFDLASGHQVDCQAVAGDTVNGVALHPSLGIMATASGHRRYMDPGGASDDDSGSRSPHCAAADDGASAKRPPRPCNSLLLWRMQLQSFAVPGV